MATHKKAGSVRGPRWTELAHAVHQAGSALLCIAHSQLGFLKPKEPPQDGRRVPVDLMYLLYEINERMQTLSETRQKVAKCMLGTIFVVCTFTAFFMSFTSGGDRWVINPLIAEFEYPLIPEHAIKVFVFCKYSFAVCVVYNLMRYAVDRKDEIVKLMDKLEREAGVLLPGQSTESRLDASVPRSTDDSTALEARQLIAMRRLLHRGMFVFDVVPEPEPIEEPEPTEDELQVIREAMELEAVKRMNDPKMLREYIRRRESRQGRRRVHMYKMKERRNKMARSTKGMRVDSPLNVIVEEDSASQSHVTRNMDTTRCFVSSTNKRQIMKRTGNRPQKDIGTKICQKISERRSHVSQKSQKSQLSKSDSTKSDLKRSWRIPGVASFKADGDRLSCDIADVFPKVVTPSGPRGLIDYLPCVVPRGPPLGKPVSCGGQRVSLQAAKWPVSGTCRPVRSRPPSPSATQTLLTRTSVSSSGADSRPATPTSRPASRPRVSPCGSPAAEPSSTTASAAVSRERNSRPVKRAVVTTTASRRSPTPTRRSPTPTHRSTTPSRTTTVSPRTTPPTTPLSTPTAASLRRPQTGSSRSTSRPPAEPLLNNETQSGASMLRQGSAGKNTSDRPSTAVRLSSTPPPSPPTPPSPRAGGDDVTSRVPTERPPLERPPSEKPQSERLPPEKPPSEKPLTEKPPSERPPSQRRRTPTGTGAGTHATWRRDTVPKSPLRSPPGTPTGPLYGRGKSRDRRPATGRRPKEPSAKSADGTRTWRQEERQDQSHVQKKPKVSNVIYDASPPKSGSDDAPEADVKTIVEEANPKDNAGGDTPNEIMTKNEKLAETEKKQEVEISNLLEPRADWSDSASSLSGVSPSLTSTLRAFSDFAAPCSQDSSDDSNVQGH